MNSLGIISGTRTYGVNSNDNEIQLKLSLLFYK